MIPSVYFLSAGLSVLLAGGLLWLTVAAFGRRSSPRKSGLPSSVPSKGGKEQTDALVWITPQGRLTHANPLAKRWFAPHGIRLSLDTLTVLSTPVGEVRTLAEKEGRAVIRIREKLYDVSSHSIGSDGKSAMEIRFRPLPTEPIQEISRAGPAPDFLRSAFSSLNLSRTARNILAGLLPQTGADWAMITLWDPIHRVLRPECSLAGTSLEPSLALPSGSIQPGEGPTGYLSLQRKPVWIPDLDQQTLFPRIRTDEKNHFRSFLGFPLEISGELLGTLEFYHLRPEAFSEKTLAQLAASASIAASALQNAMVYGTETRRTAEATALSEIARTACALAAPDIFFDQLIKALIPAIDAQFFGFLLYNDGMQSLEPRPPFHGVPSHLLPMLRIPLTEGKPAHSRWDSMESFFANGPDTEPLFRELGISPAAKALEIGNAAIMALGAAGDSTGWFWIANKRGSPVDDEDIRRWTPLALQAGRQIRNLVVLEKYRRQSDQADFIRRLATFAASPPPLDEFLHHAMEDLSHILGSEQAALFLLDESHDEIQLVPASAIGLSEQEIQRFATFYTVDPLCRYAVTFTGKSFIARDAVHSSDLPSYYRPWVDFFLTNHLIATPLMVRGHGIGELIAGRREGAFDPDELTFLAAVAGQLAGTIEREQLFTTTDASLQRRVEQLTSLTRISRELNTTIDLPYLLRLIYDEALRITGADCGRIALLDPERPTSPARPLLLIGDSLADGCLPSWQKEILDGGKPHLIRDMTAETPGGDHEGILSAFLLPVIYQQHTVGLIDLHSRHPGWFNRESFEIVQAYGIEIAIAVGNAHRFEEQAQTNQMLQRRGRLVSTIHQSGKTALSAAPLAGRLETIAQNIHDTLGLAPVVIGRVHGKSFEWLARAGLPDGAWHTLQTMHIPLPSIHRWTSAKSRPEGYIPFPSAPKDAEARRFSAVFKEELGVHEILLLPLRDSEEKLIGLLVAASISSARPEADFPFLEIFVSQATTSIQTDVLQQALAEQRKPAKARGEAESRSQDEIREKEARDLKLRLNRLLALFQVSEFLSTQAEPQALLDTLAGKIIENFSMDTVIIASEGPGGPRLRLAKGKLPAEGQVEMLLGQHNPILTMIQSDNPILVLSLDTAPTWQNSPLLSALKAHSFLCFPIRSHTQTDAVVLLTSQEAVPPFQAGDESLFQLLGEQAAIYLENTRLLEETRRRLREGNVLLEFSRRIAGLDLPLILQALVDGTRDAIPEAEGAMAALWDEASSALAVRAGSGYANTQRLYKIACAVGEGLPGQTYRAARPIHWPHVDMATDFNLSPENLEAYRNGSLGLIPASALGVPLQVGDKLLGIVLLENFTAAEAFSKSHAEVALSLANQAALALEKARLFQEMMDRTRELDERASHLALLNRLTNAAITTSSERSLLESACKELAAAFDVPQSAAVLIQPNRSDAPVIAEYIYPGRPSAMSLTIPLRGSPIIETALQTRSPVHIENSADDDRLGALRYWVEVRRVTSVLLVPMLIGDEAAGLILIESPEQHSFSYDDLALAQTVSAQLGQALENVRLHQNSQAKTSDLETRVVERTTALEREHRRAGILLRISTELVASLDLDQVLTRALQLVNEAIGADQAAIVLLDSETQNLVYRAALEKDAPLPKGGRSLPFHAGEGLAGWVIQQRQPVILPDLAKDPRWIHLYPDEPMRYRSALAVPLMVGSDALGVLLLQSHNPAVFNPEQLTLASAAANQVAAAINNAELYRLIRDQADRLGELVRIQQVESRKSLAMLEAIADGVMVTDSENQIVLFNGAAERVLGLRRDAVWRRPAGEFIGLFGKAGRTWQEQLVRWQERPSQITGGEYLAERITLDNGKVLSVHLAPISSGVEFLGTVAVFRDITQDVEVDRLKSEFVATVSHELRTPLTAIRGYVEILMMGATGGLNDSQNTFLKTIKENSDRLEMLVNDLLDISRMESGQIRLNLDVVEIPKVLENAAQSLREKCRTEGRSLKIVVEASPDVPFIQADRARVTEILGNLTENAYLYTPDGGTITLRASSHPDGVLIDVSDTGIGISPAERKRLFERFFRGEHPMVMAAPGTGLGLAITIKLVEMHGGSITVESEGVPGKGSTFHVILPRDAVES